MLVSFLENVPACILVDTHTCKVAEFNSHSSVGDPIIDIANAVWLSIYW